MARRFTLARLFVEMAAPIEEQFHAPEVLLFEWTALMPRYYFDMREGDEIASDEEGMELDTLEEVQEEAARTLADMAKDGIRGGRTNGARGPMFNRGQRRRRADIAGEVYVRGSPA
jgi:hypothetical protein